MNGAVSKKRWLMEIGIGFMLRECGYFPSTPLDWHICVHPECIRQEEGWSFFLFWQALSPKRKDWISYIIS